MWVVVGRHCRIFQTGLKPVVRSRTLSMATHEMTVAQWFKAGFTLTYYRLGRN